jgi:hypothetical protein
MSADDALLEPIRRFHRRMETGPMCALCRHVSLTVNHLPALFLTTAADATVCAEVCPRVRRPVMADEGADCAYFERGPHRDA